VLEGAEDVAGAVGRGGVGAIVHRSIDRSAIFDRSIDRSSNGGAEYRCVEREYGVLKDVEGIDVDVDRVVGAICDCDRSIDESVDGGSGKRA
jgi:hypothetical protein